jgi:hypothetical protein
MEIKAPESELDWPISYTLESGETIIASAWAVDRSFAPQLSDEGRDGRLRAWRAAVAKA